MSQPLNRRSMLPELGEVDEEAGEFWFANPFMMISQGANLSAYERNKLYLNLNGESFLDASFTSGADIDSDSRSVVAGDFTGDGAPDLLVASVGGGTLRLFENQYEQGNRVALELIGVESNRFAIGTRAIASVGNQKIVRDLFPANGFMGQGPAHMSIGIGVATKIDELTIRWPTGKVETFKDIPAGKTFTITEADRNSKK